MSICRRAADLNVRRRLRRTIEVPAVRLSGVISRQRHRKRIVAGRDSCMTTTNDTADALIIGAGPTGAVAAKRLAEADMRVVVLEQGDWPDYSKARAGHADYEITAGRDW